MPRHFLLDVQRSEVVFLKVIIFTKTTMSQGRDLRFEGECLKLFEMLGKFETPNEEGKIREANSLPARWSFGLPY